MLTKLDALIAEDGPFTVLATEFKAQVLIRDGQQDEALKVLETLLARDGLDRELQARAEILRDSLGAGS